MASLKLWWALTPLAAATIVLGERPAQAILNYYIYESGGNVIMETSGSLSLSSPITASSTCRVPVGGLISTTNAGFCAGQEPFGISYTKYAVTGPTSLSVTAGSVFGLADFTTGLGNFISGAANEFYINSTYSSGNPVTSNATFNNKTLGTGSNGLGFTTTGLIGTWTLTSTNDTINVCVGLPGSPCGAGAPPAAPGPLPLLGAGAAFGFSRRLRRRVNISRSSSEFATSISA